jgi:hypothetical protein
MANFNTLPIQASPATGDKVFSARGTAVGAEQSVSLLAIQTLFQTAYDARYGAVAGSTSIVTVGTITVGAWNGTTIAVANGGTGATTSTGSGAVVLATSPVLVAPSLGTPTSGVLTNCTGAPILALTNMTGVLTSPTFVTPVLGTPTSGNLANCTNLPHAAVVGLSTVAVTGSYTDLLNSPITLSFTGAPPFDCNGFIPITIGGTTYKLLAST